MAIMGANGRRRPAVAPATRAAALAVMAAAVVCYTGLAGGASGASASGGREGWVEPADPAGDALQGQVWGGGFLPLDGLEAGMRGAGLTVFEGSRVEGFDVVVLGVLKATGSASSYVLVEVGGPGIDSAGGLAAGMSGSPVYVGGKLVGAVSFGYELSDHRLALVTPIADMLQVWNPAAAPEGQGARTQTETQTRTQTRTQGLVPAGARPIVVPGSGMVITEATIVIDPSAHEDAGPAGRSSHTGKGEGIRFVPVTTPVMVSGLGQRGFSAASGWLARLGAKALPGGAPSVAGASSLAGPGSGSGSTSAKLEPGGALGAQLLWGDVSMTGVGTVTYVKDGRALAFGHGFLVLGDCDYRATGAYVHRSARAIDMPFKIASATEAIGRVDQDRTSALSVTEGEAPRGVRLRVTVTDTDRTATRGFEAWGVRDERLIADIVGLFALGCLDLALGRVGDGTCAIECVIGGGRSGGGRFELRRRNTFYSPEDISADALIEVVEDTRILASNYLEDVTLDSVEITAGVARKRDTAQILRAKALKGSYRPGATVPIEVTLRPYREKPVVVTAQLKLPADCPEGSVYVTVRPGGEGEGKGGGDAAGDGRPASGDGEGGTQFEDLGEMLEDMASRLTNTDLVVEFIPEESDPGEGEPPPEQAAPNATPQDGGVGPPAGQDQAPERQAPKGHKPAGEGAQGKEPKPEVRVVIPTTWVLSGACGVEIEIEAETEAQAETVRGEPAESSTGPGQSPAPPALASPGPGG